MHLIISANNKARTCFELNKHNSIHLSQEYISVVFLTVVFLVLIALGFVAIFLSLFFPSYVYFV